MNLALPLPLAPSVFEDVREALSATFKALVHTTKELAPAVASDTYNPSQFAGRADLNSFMRADHAKMINEYIMGQYGCAPEHLNDYPLHAAHQTARDAFNSYSESAKFADRNLERQQGFNYASQGPIGRMVDDVMFNIKHPILCGPGGY